MASARFFIQYLPTIILYHHVPGNLSIYTVKAGDLKVVEATLKDPANFVQPWADHWIYLGIVYVNSDFSQL